MKTNINYTYEILGGYLMSNNKLNVGYFADAVMLVSDNDSDLYQDRFNTRRKTRNIAIHELMAFINRELKFAGYTGYYATNKQIMKWDREHDGGLEAALDIIEAKRYTDPRRVQIIPDQRQRAGRNWPTNIIN